MTSPLKMLLDFLFPFHNDRCGKHHGMFATIATCQSGCKTIIFCIETIDHRYHRFVRVSNLYSESIRKPATFGRICWVVLPLSASLLTFWHVHRLKYNYRKKSFSVPSFSVQLFAWDSRLLFTHCAVIRKQLVNSFPSKYSTIKFHSNYNRMAIATIFLEWY